MRLKELPHFGVYSKNHFLGNSERNRQHLCAWWLQVVLQIPNNKTHEETEWHWAKGSHLSVFSGSFEGKGLQRS